jgi:hypothetical protein
MSDLAARKGLVGLGALYDEYGEQLLAMKLPEAFDAAGFIEVGFYCRLREKYPGVKAMQLAFGNYDYSVGKFSVDVGDRGEFGNAWANRGESVYIDYLVIREEPDDSVAPR